MKLIDRAQAPLFDDVNEDGEPIVTHVFGVIRVVDRFKEYLYDVRCGRDLFVDAGGTFPLFLRRFDKEERPSISDFDLQEYCEGMANIYSREVQNLRADRGILVDNFLA